MNARKARLKRQRGSDCAGSPTWRQESLPFSLSAAIRRGIPFVAASSPIVCARRTTDERRTTTTNSISSHHHDSAPSRPHPLICTGAEPIQAVAPRNEVILLPFWRGLSVQKLFVYVFDLCYLHGSDFIQLCSGGVGYSWNHVSKTMWACLEVGYSWNHVSKTMWAGLVWQVSFLNKFCWI